MKNYIKGVITGIIIGAIICSIPALADTIDALFNQVRISVNGVDQIQRGENITLTDGAETPASILYNGTTYLPMRKLGELSGNKIYWNGDSRTVGMTGAQKDIKALAEKPDKNGNVWKYYTFKVSEYNRYDKVNYDISYLGVKDENRGYERIYKLGCDDIGITDNAIYFVKIRDGADHMPTDKYGDDKYGPYGDFMKLSFDNDEDTQDGERVFNMSDISRVFIDDEYIYYMWYAAGNARNYSVITVYDYLTNERWHDGSRASGSYMSDFEISENNTEYVEFKYTFDTPIKKSEVRKTFNKTNDRGVGWEKIEIN